MKKTMPSGKSLFLKLIEANTYFNEEGSYDGYVLLDKNDPEVQEFVDTLNEVASKALSCQIDELNSNPKTRTKVKDIASSIPVEDDFDPETGQPTGLLKVKVKRAAKTGKPTVVTWEGNPFSGKFIENDSEVMIAVDIRASYIPAHNKVFVTLKPLAAKVREDDGLDMLGLQSQETSEVELDSNVDASDF